MSRGLLEDKKFVEVVLKIYVGKKYSWRLSEEYKVSLVRLS